MARIFYQLAKLNKRDRMFEVQGKHTFFFPVDSAFEVSATVKIKRLKVLVQTVEVILKSFFFTNF